MFEGFEEREEQSPLSEEFDIFTGKRTALKAILGLRSTQTLLR